MLRTITATGSTNSHSVVVTVNPLPAAVAGADRAINLNTGTQIGATAVTGSTYSWSSVPAGFTSTLANPTVTPLVTTTYTVVETITATGSTNSHSIVVTLNPTEIASIGDDKTIAIYPNPFTTSISIIINDASQIDKCQLRIYNVLGIEVKNTTITKQLSTLETRGIPSGIYFYRLIDNSKTIQSGKLIAK